MTRIGEMKTVKFHGILLLKMDVYLEADKTALHGTVAA